MRVVEGHGFGKLILVGEHAVVYGHPALAFGVDRGTTLRVAGAEGPTQLHMPGPRAPAPDPRLRALMSEHFGDTGAHLTLTTDLPIGRGMGSSASLAVALARAHLAWNSRPADPDALWSHAMATERRFHGNPSGVDVACALHGGVLRFVRGAPPTFTSLACPAWQVVVLDSGVAGPTAELVERVRRQRPRIDLLLERVGELVGEAEEALHDPPALGRLLDENHAILRQIGVSSPTLDDLVGLARGAGAWGAKLSGAGGGGVVIALAEDPAPILQAAQAARVPAFVVRPQPGGPP